MKIILSHYQKISELVAFILSQKKKSFYIFLQRLTLIQNAMFIAGLITLIQLYPIWKVGARLPVVMGTSSGFI